ncbi:MULTISPECIES: DUF6431 domain-containing protein [Blautia]|uniref:DUF6431 domain-containing protein n=1 Tax=Blautia TaxID=572511 RepID=UPI0038B9DFFF
MCFSRSNEKYSCPQCGGQLVSRNSQIRRLKCKDCNRPHTELPDFIHPLRHYYTGTLQDVLNRK